MKLNNSKNLSDSLLSEAPDSSGQWIQQRHGSASTVLNAGKNVNNFSVQTGEEFSMEFLQDRSATRGIRPMPITTQNREKRVGHNDDRNPQLGYEDLARILGLKRMDSECASDISDFAAAKESFRETENGAFVEKLSRCNMEDGDTVHRSRKAFGELNCDQGAGLIPVIQPIYVSEYPHSSNFDGPKVLDRSQPGKMKLLCSFGGKILPRPSDGKLRYVGGETRIISIYKNLTWEELVKKTSGICDQPHSIKYQLPDEDLDALISVSSDEDLQHMIEEYHGLERLEGSQRLRIFLIPLGDSEKSSSFEATTIQQGSPDYQYVVAVNGIFDPSPKKNSGGMGLASEANQTGIILDRNPSFHKHSPSSLLPLDIKGDSNAFHPTRFSNESQNPYQSPPISPVPLQHGDSKSVHRQLQGDSSSIESSSSFMTAQLPSENCSTDTAAHKQPPQGPVTLLNCHHPCKHVDGGHPEQPHGVKFHNHSFSKDLVTPSVLDQNDGDFDGFSCERPVHKERVFHSVTPLLSPADPLGLLSRSIDSIDSHHGMPHAFSDSKLQEHGGMSAYCSQEGMSPSSPLNFAKTQLSPLLISSASQENPTQLHETINFVNPLAQSKLPDIESTGLQGMPDLLKFSPSSVSIVRNEPIQKGVSSTDDKCLTPSHCEENSLGLEMMNRVNKIDPFLHLDEKTYEEKSPAAGMEYKNKLPDVGCIPTYSGVDTSAQSMQVSADMVPATSVIDFKPSVNNLIEHSENYQLEEVNGEQGSDILRTEKPEVELFLNARRLPHNENSLVDLISASSNGSIFPEPMHIQPLESQNAVGNREPMPMSPAKFNPIAVYDNADPIANLGGNDLLATAHNAAKDASYDRQVSLLDDHGTGLDLKVEKLGFGGSAYEKSNTDDITLAQTKTMNKIKDPIQLEPLVILEDGTGNVLVSIQSICAFVPHNADPTGHHAISLTAAKSKSILPCIATYAVDPTSHHFISSTATDSEGITAHVRPHVADLTSGDFVSSTATESKSVIPESVFEV